MSNETDKQANVGDPHEAEPGRGAPGEQYGVQLAQNPHVNAPDEVIPSNVDVNKNIKNIRAEEAQEAADDAEPIHTTHGYALDESGRLDNFAVEPQMYVEEPGDRGDQH